MDVTHEDAPVVREWLGVLLRKRYWLLIPAIIGTLIAGIIASVMDPEYESTATILIESQQIPTSLVASPVTAYADERIAKIRQQILSRTNLLELIERNKLYPKERSQAQLSEVIALMKNAIRVDLVSADSGSSAARSGKATIAFNLAFNYTDPGTTQSVTDQLTAMFIDADMRRRTEQASGTASFLTRRADELRERLVVMESEMSTVRRRYNGALPDQIISGSSSGATMRGELARIDLELQSVMASNAALAAQMGQPEEVAPTELSRAEENLARLTAVYSDSHPDVRSAREVVSALRRNSSTTPARSNRSMLAAELQAGRIRAASLGQRRAQVEAAVVNADRLVAASPQAAYELNKLQRDYDGLKEQYESIRNRQLEAQVAANLESEEKGERFTLVEPPSLPEEPVRPNRPFIVLIGLMLGIGLGMAAILANELFVRPVHSPAAMVALTGVPTLSVLPLNKPGAPKGPRRWSDSIRHFRMRKAAS